MGRNALPSMPWLFWPNIWHNRFFLNVIFLDRSEHLCGVEIEPDWDLAAQPARRTTRSISALIGDRAKRRFRRATGWPCAWPALCIRNHSFGQRILVVNLPSRACRPGEEIHDDRWLLNGAILPLMWLNFLSVTLLTHCYW